MRPVNGTVGVLTCDQHTVSFLNQVDPQCCCMFRTLWFSCLLYWQGSREREVKEVWQFVHRKHWGPYVPFQSGVETTNRDWGRQIGWPELCSLQGACRKRISWRRLRVIFTQRLNNFFLFEFIFLLLRHKSSAKTLFLNALMQLAFM